MGAGDGDTALQAHQFGEHFGAPHHRDAQRARLHQFRIVALDGRGHHHDTGAGHIVGGMADGDGNALVAQPLDVGALGDVGAAHRVAEIVQHLGDPAHADAADPDEMNGSDFPRQSHSGLSLSSCPPLRRIHES